MTPPQEILSISLTQFLAASALGLALTRTGTLLFFKPAWATITRHWLEALGRHG